MNDPVEEAMLTTSRLPPRRRLTAFRLVVPLLSVFIVGLAAELTVHFVAPQETTFFSFEAFNHLDGSLVPGRNGRLCGVAVEINSYGERGTPHDRHKQPGTFRICVIGDSIVFGIGIKEEDRYPCVLQRLLRERMKDEDIEVVPFSQVAYGLSAYRQRLLPRALAFDPDLLLLGFVLNDFELPPQLELASNAADEFGPRRHGIPGMSRGLMSELRKYSHLAYLVRRYVRRLSWATLIDKDDLTRRWELEAMYPSTDDFRVRRAYTFQQLDRIHAGCRANGVQFVIAVTPFDVQLGEDRLRYYRQYVDDLPYSCVDAIPQMMLEEYSAERRIEFIDFTPHFKKHSRQVMWQVLEDRPDMCHPNAEGNRLMAEILAERLAPIISARRNEGR